MQRIRAVLGGVAAFALATAPALSASAETAGVVDSVVPRAICGAGSTPERGLQGQVPSADRQSGRSERGYACNLELLGQYQGEGTSWVNQSYGHCAYHSTTVAGLGRKKSEGVQVVDASNPRRPVLSANLTSPAMLTGTWESLKVNERRGLLAGASGGALIGSLAVDVYDVKTDCAHPTLLNSFSGSDFTLPVTTLNHEGQWSPDGKTYWTTSTAGGGITAIDLRNPTNPRIAGIGTIGVPNHGFDLSADGNRMYLTTAFPAGVIVLDVSEIQARKPVPVIRELGRVTWGGPASASQHTIPVTWDGRPYLIAVDEFAGEAVHVLDISDERKPTVIRQIQLEIQRPGNAAVAAAEVAENGAFGYDAHYCTVDRPTDPTALACGFFQSGVRVFDIRDPRTPREIAYFNPPAQVGRQGDLLGSEHATHPVMLGNNVSNVRDAGPGVLATWGRPTDLTADYCSSPPRFVGANQLWISCQDNGFLALRFTNDAYRSETPR